MQILFFLTLTLAVANFLSRRSGGGTGIRIGAGKAGKVVRSSSKAPVNPRFSPAAAWKARDGASGGQKAAKGAIEEVRKLPNGRSAAAQTWNGVEVATGGPGKMPDGLFS